MASIRESNNAIQRCLYAAAWKEDIPLIYLEGDT